MKRVYIFGAGEGGVLAVRHLLKQKGMQVLKVLDNDAGKSGQTLCGVPITTPDTIKDTDFDQIRVASCYHQEIYSQLIDLGVHDSRIEFEDIAALMDQAQHRKKQIWGLAAITIVGSLAILAMI